VFACVESNAQIHPLRWQMLHAEVGNGTQEGKGQLGNLAHMLVPVAFGNPRADQVAVPNGFCDVKWQESIQQMLAKYSRK
jgi:hypothetical protein